MRNSYFIAFVSIVMALTTNARLAQAQAQRTPMATIDFTPCVRNAFCLDCGDPPASLQGNTPNELFHAKLSTEGTQKIKGTLLVHVIVDTLGHACCDRIQYSTTASAKQIQALNIPDCIAQVDWAPARGKNGVSASAIFLKITFNGKKGFVADYRRMGQIISIKGTSE